MDTKDLLIQIVGLIGAALGILSYQFKDNRKYFAGQALSGLCFGFHFLLLGAYTGSLLNFINLLRGFGFAVEKKKKPYVTFITVSILYLAATASTYDGGLSMLACAAQLVGSIGMFSRHPAGMRVLQFTLVSPAWMIYNGCVGSAGGIVCEAFNMTSIAVYFIRTKFLKSHS